MKHMKRTRAPCEGKRRSGLAMDFHIFVAEETRERATNTWIGSPESASYPSVRNERGIIIYNLVFLAKCLLSRGWERVEGERSWGSKWEDLIWFTNSILWETCGLEWLDLHATVLDLYPSFATYFPWDLSTLLYFLILSFFV